MKLWRDKTAWQADNTDKRNDEARMQSDKGMTKIVAAATAPRNRGKGISEIEGKGAQGSAEQGGRRASFKSVLAVVETHSFPKSFAATLAALPSMSLLLVAPFSVRFPTFVSIRVHSWFKKDGFGEAAETCTRAACASQFVLSVPSVVETRSLPSSLGATSRLYLLCRSSQSLHCFSFFPLIRVYLSRL